MLWYTDKDNNSLYEISIGSENGSVEANTNGSGMFAYCTSLKTINLTSFDTSKVTTMQSMFLLCKSIEMLDLSTFTTDGATTIMYMFDTCSSLKSLDIRNASFSSVSKNTSAFNVVNSNVVVYVKNDTEKEFIINTIKNIISDNVIVG